MLERTVPMFGSPFVTERSSCLSCEAEVYAFMETKRNGVPELRMLNVQPDHIPHWVVVSDSPTGLHGGLHPMASYTYTEHICTRQNDRARERHFHMFSGRRGIYVSNGFGIEWGHDWAFLPYLVECPVCDQPIGRRCRNLGATKSDKFNRYAHEKRSQLSLRRRGFATRVVRERGRRVMAWIVPAPPKTIRKKS